MKNEITNNEAEEIARFIDEVAELEETTKLDFSNLPKISRFKRIPVIVSVLRFLNMNYSYCQKCGLPWNHCVPKNVRTTKTTGTFATCDICWYDSTLEELKDCYTKTYKNQEACASEGGYDMAHSYTLEHLLSCVEDEYNKTHKTQILNSMPKKELITGYFYWVKSTKASQWEIAKFEKAARAFKGNDVFGFTESRYSYRQDCFEIDYEPIGRK